MLNNYSGHTRAYWTHEADTPTVLNGGNIRIKDAEAGSVFYLATSRDGVTGDNEEAVLNALANKLYYEKLKTDENDTSESDGHPLKFGSRPEAGPGAVGRTGLLRRGAVGTPETDGRQTATVRVISPEKGTGM